MKIFMTILAAMAFAAPSAAFEFTVGDTHLTSNGQPVTITAGTSDATNEDQFGSPESPSSPADKE